jgi:flagellar biosynthesis/type III secretory pathway M-ring protein FliF/YscJ
METRLRRALESIVGAIPGKVYAIVRIDIDTSRPKGDKETNYGTFSALEL